MRGSFVTPLILVGLGALLLWNNIRPDISIWSLIAEFWPYLLIVWGVIRLAEILFLAARNRPLPARGVSGGEWALIVIFSMVGSGFVFANDFRERIRSGRVNVRGIQIFGENFDYPVKASATVPAKPRIIVENRRGNIRLVGSNTTQLVVTGRNAIQALDRTAADQIAERIKLEINVTGDQVIVRTNLENGGPDNRAEADLDIQIPQGASVECRGTFGDFDVSQIQGAFTVNSDNAGVRGQDIGGDVRIEVRRSDIIRLTKVAGNVEVKGARAEDIELDQVAGLVSIDGQFTGDVDFRHLAKSLRFNSKQTDLNVDRLAGRLHMSGGDLEGEDIKGLLRLRSRSKDVRLTGFEGGLDIELDRGDIELQPSRTGSGIVSAKTSSGNLTLHLPESAKFDLDAYTRKGEIDNAYGSPLRQSESNHGGSIRGSVGSGPRLKLETNRGRLTVTKGGIFESHFDIPPVPPLAPAAPKVPKPPSLVER